MTLNLERDKLKSPSIALHCHLHYLLQLPLHYLTLTKTSSTSSNSPLQCLTSTHTLPALKFLPPLPYLNTYITYSPIPPPLPYLDNYYFHLVRFPTPLRYLDTSPTSTTLHRHLLYFTFPVSQGHILISRGKRLV